MENHGKSQSEMDDDWGYRHDFGNPPYDPITGKPKEFQRSPDSGRNQARVKSFGQWQLVPPGGLKACALLEAKFIIQCHIISIYYTCITCFWWNNAYTYIYILIILICIIYIYTYVYIYIYIYRNIMCNLQHLQLILVFHIDLYWSKDFVICKTVRGKRTHQPTIPWMLSLYGQTWMHLNPCLVWWGNTTPLQ